MNPAELHLFYEDMVRALRQRGVVCAITSGLACVHYGIAETTKDCDLLCHPDCFGALLELLEQTPLGDQPCRYRGHISPPLDGRWHLGGWTSHFEWDTKPTATTLDVFGRALRESEPWEYDISGLYAGMNVVAEMKRTDRDKDWPFINDLGVEMLRAGDARGWLHLFDEDSVNELQKECSIPRELMPVRPVLELAINRAPGLREALMVERHFWQELDRLRIRVYRAALRPYVLALGRARISGQLSLQEQHEARLACATKTLAESPLASYGISRLIEAARKATAGFVKPELLKWLPNVRNHFKYIEE